MDTAQANWTRNLEEEDWQFLKRFLLSSGSLKALAAEYGISYPTVRNRLDRLIAKVQAADEPGALDVFHQRLRGMVAEGRLDRQTARTLLDAHQEALGTKPEDDTSA